MIPNGYRSSAACSWPMRSRPRPSSTAPPSTVPSPRPSGAADHLGQDRNDHWTAFGPTNVRIHQISAAVAFGDAGTAVETGDRLDLQRLPAGLAGRRSQVSLDLARAYAQQRHDAAAVNMLLDAERIAPQLVRYDTATHDLLTLLLRREHRASTPQLRPLARRAGAI
jgi:hypothetical protein